MITPGAVIEMMRESLKDTPQRDTIKIITSDVSAAILMMTALKSIGINFEFAVGTENKIIYPGKIEYTFKELRELGMLYWLGKNGINPMDSHVVYVGPEGKLEYSIAAGAMTETYPGAPKFSEILRLADLIITTHKINCYPVHVPVIDLNWNCINTRYRDVFRDKYGEFLAIGALLCI